MERNIPHFEQLAHYCRRNLSQEVHNIFLPVTFPEVFTSKVPLVLKEDRVAKMISLNDEKLKDIIEMYIKSKILYPEKEQFAFSFYCLKKATRVDIVMDNDDALTQDILQRLK